MTPQRHDRLLKVLKKRQPNLTVVLENVFDPHNVSAVMRTCDAVGIQEVYILNDRTPPHKKWGHRSSSTAAKWLTIHQFTRADECFAEVRSKYGQVLVGFLNEKAADVYSLDLTGSIALVFGNETFGVSEHILQYATGTFIIPQTGVIKSLNISVACAITLYEAFRQKRMAGQYDSPQLPQNQFDSLKQSWGLHQYKGHQPEQKD